jgi:hypothetical protein
MVGRKFVRVRRDATPWNARAGAPGSSLERNAKCYEQTQHLIENKEQDFASPAGI